MRVQGGQVTVTAMEGLGEQAADGQVTVTTMEGLGEQAEECRWVIAGDDSETRAMLFLHLKYDFHSENYDYVAMNANLPHFIYLYL